MKCENLDKCPFYNDKMNINSGLGLMYKRKYCEGDKTKCARYIVSSKLGKEFVPSNLYPNMNKKAEEILKDNKSK
ncbi:hypothetical protein [Clostridium oceanicum]|uniref:Uracil-DNA glycosylase n=1 Tax=Clostridium oceanicum TaxID=1543 RepID=A0ABN1JEJ7_9CLOT